jgi:hypothetical protein
VLHLDWMIKPEIMEKMIIIAERSDESVALSDVILCELKKGSKCMLKNNTVKTTKNTIIFDKMLLIFLLYMKNAFPSLCGSSRNDYTPPRRKKLRYDSLPEVGKAVMMKHADSGFVHTYTYRFLNFGILRFDPKYFRV